MDEFVPKTIGEILGFHEGDSPSAQIFREYLRVNGSFRTEEELRKLPLKDRYLWLLFRYQQQVMNSGIDGFLSNSSGYFAVETLEALAAIGASGDHRRLEEALRLFPDGRPSEDDETRKDQVLKILARMNVESLHEIVGCGESDDDDFNRTLLSFLRRHSSHS